MMQVACPKCFWATDDVQITLSDTKGYVDTMNMLVTCKQKHCKKSHIVKITIVSMSELVPVTDTPSKEESKI